MNADVIFIAERLPQRVDGLEAQGGGIQGVDAEMGATACMRGDTGVRCFFGNAAIATTVAFKTDVFRDSGMDQDTNVHIIHIPAVQEFHFAAEIMDETLFPQGIPVGDLD